MVCVWQLSAPGSECNKMFLKAVMSVFCCGEYLRVSHKVQQNKWICEIFTFVQRSGRFIIVLAAKLETTGR